MNARLRARDVTVVSGEAQPWIAFRLAMAPAAAANDVFCLAVNVLGYGARNYFQENFPTGVTI